MKTIIYTLILLISIIKLSYAQLNTDEMLSAPNARSFIQLWPDFGEQKFFYILDKDQSRKHYKSLKTGFVLGVPKRKGEITLTMRFFNPLQYNVVTTDSLLEDPSYQNIGKFATILTQLIKDLPIVSEQPVKSSSKTSTTGSEPSSSSSLAAPFSLSTAGNFTKEQVKAVVQPPINWTGIANSSATDSSRISLVCASF